MAKFTMAQGFHGKVLWIDPITYLVYPCFLWPGDSSCIGRGSLWSLQLKVVLL